MREQGSSDATWMEQGRSGSELIHSFSGLDYGIS